MHKGTIIYIGNFELPDKNAAAHRVMNNGKIFKDIGYRVVYLGTVRDENFDGIRVSSYDKDIYEEAYPIGTKKWINHIFDTSNLQKVIELYDDVCMVIVYNVPYANFKAVKKLCSAKNIKVAYDCTEWNSFAEGSLPKRLYKKLDEYQVRNKLGKKCRDIIVISSCMANKYKNANLLKLPPLVDTNDSIWHQQRENSDGKFVFCFAGTISNKEKIQNVVSAFCKIADDNICFRIIGMTKEDYLSSFPEHKAMLENETRIDFMGRLSHTETVRNVLSSNCYIFVRESTRRNEAGFPTKFAEAFTCGVPIISTDVSDIKEFADNRVVLLNDTDESSIARAINDAVSNSCKENHISKTFDYRTYVSNAESWLQKVFE